MAAAGQAAVPDQARVAQPSEAEPARAPSTSTSSERLADLTGGAVGPSLAGGVTVEAKPGADTDAAEHSLPSTLSMSPGSVAIPDPKTTKAAEAVATTSLASTPPVGDLPAGDPPELLALLVSRGNALLKAGDIGGARRMFEQAARSGSREGAVAAGKTYDPNFLDYPGAPRASSDKQAAAAWYRQALAQGDRKAAGLLAQLGGVGE